MKNKILLSGFVILLFLSLTILYAGETGSVSGVIRAYEGQPLENATVKISGTLLPAGRQMVTKSDGKFRFLYLPPGKYTLDVTHPEMLDLTLEVRVELNRDTQVAAIMFSVPQEEVEVTAIAPLVDIKSTELSTNWKAEDMEALPLGRSFTSLFQLAPGVAENQSGAPNAGGNRQDNVYLYDGANITNPHFGTLSANFNQFDIEEVEFKRGAVNAEFGRSSGIVVNAITKSGSNKLSGNLRFIYDPAAFTWETKDPELKRKNDTMNFSFGLGGPLLKDKLWWYTSGRYLRDILKDRHNNLGDVPDAETDRYEFFGKLSYRPHQSHLFAANYRLQPYKNTNTGIGVNSHPDVGRTSEGHNSIIMLSWNWQISNNSYFDVKFVRVDEDSKSKPLNDIGYDVPFNPVDPSLSGEFLTTSQFIVGGATESGQYVGVSATGYDEQSFTRNDIKAVFTQYLDFPGHSHLIKAGFGYDNGSEFLDRTRNGWGQIRVWSDDPAATRRFRGRYYTPQTQDSCGATYSIFVQDAVTIADRITLNLGVLLNRDEFSSETEELGKRKFLTFDFFDEIQPRLGFNLVTDKAVGDKIYGSFGRYNNTDNKSISHAAAPIRLHYSYTYFNNAGDITGEGVYAAETGKKISPDIKPTYTDEYIVGYSRPITTIWVVDLWYQYRHTHDIIEDFPRIKYPKPKDWIYDNYPGAYRKYKTFCIKLEKRYAHNWSLVANYSWSRLSGNWDLDYSSVGLYYASSWIGDGPGLYIGDETPEERNRDGLMYGDRTHVFKLFAYWRFLENTLLGGYFRAQSGGAWQPLEKTYYGNYLGYAEPAGSRRTPAWYNLDLQLQQVIPLGEYNVTIEARFMNVFNTQTVTGYDARFDQPTFLDSTSYASPRRFVLTASINF